MLDKKHSSGPDTERLLNRVHTAVGPRLILFFLIFLQRKYPPTPQPAMACTGRLEPLWVWEGV